jgi:peptidoglycan/LPS O-acetylase OafA/YrhL
MALAARLPAEDSLQCVKPNPFRRLPGADGIRVLALGAVFLNHSIYVLGEGQPQVAVECFRLGTDLFMILSGCLIHRSLRSKPDYRAYLIRRFFRIYPVFIFMLLSYIGVFYQFLPHRSKLPPEPAAAVRMVIENLAIIPLAFNVTPIIAASWTLGFICLFYVLAPPVVYALKPCSRSVRLLVWASITILTFFVGGRAALLPLGVILSKVIDIAAAPSWIILFSTMVLVRAFNVDLQIRNICSAVAAFSFCWWALPQLRLPVRLEALSRISYSFYLTHGLAILALGLTHLPFMIATPLAFVLAVAAATVVFRLVEKPFLDFSERLLHESGRRTRG